jgi:hypothetical protein
VRVQNATYIPNHEKITIYAAPYAMDRSHVLYKVPPFDSFTEDHIALLQISLDRVATGRAAVKNAKAANVKFFEDALYTYKDPASTVLKKLTTAGYKLVDLEDMAKDIVKGKMQHVGKGAMHIAYMKHPATNMSTTKIYELTDGWEKGAVKMVTSKPQRVADKSFVDITVDILNEHSIYLNMIASMSQIYDGAMQKDHSSIWDSYEQHQMSI